MCETHSYSNGKLLPEEGVFVLFFQTMDMETSVIRVCYETMSKYVSLCILYFFYSSRMLKNVLPHLLLRMVIATLW